MTFLEKLHTILPEFTNNMSVDCLALVDRGLGYLDRFDLSAMGIEMVWRCYWPGAHNPHAWIELLLKNNLLYVWDVSGQKLKGNGMAIAHEASQQWYGFGSEGVERVIIWPEWEE